MSGWYEGRSDSIHLALTVPQSPCLALFLEVLQCWRDLLIKPATSLLTHFLHRHLFLESSGPLGLVPEWAHLQSLKKDFHWNVYRVALILGLWAEKISILFFLGKMRNSKNDSFDLPATSCFLAQGVLTGCVLPGRPACSQHPRAVEIKACPPDASILLCF